MKSQYDIEIKKAILNQWIADPSGIRLPRVLGCCEARRARRSAPDLRWRSPLLSGASGEASDVLATVRSRSGLRPESPSRHPILGVE